jgi:precorrin-2 dehydrogenase/sirohydrochlorin ferrochelatase
MKYYPINLNLKGKKCVIVGGGKVAERKVLGLLECGADITVISPWLTPCLQELWDKKKISYVPRAYNPRYLKGAHLVVASTDNARVNRQVGERAKRLGILVNIVSAPRLSDFTVPSIIRRGDFMVTISTGGKSPALSRRLRLELENTLGKEYEIFTEILGAIRRKLRAISPEKRGLMYTGVAMSNIPKLLREKKYKRAEKELKRITGLGFDEIKFSLKR